MELRLGGRFLSDDNVDQTLKTVNISCRGAFLESLAAPQSGSSIICYLDELGRIPATVVRAAAGGFAVMFNISTHKRDKIADRLTWLLNRDALGLSEDRETPRYAAGGPALVTRADGREIQCRVVDMSLTGAGFETDGPPPELGEMVTAGNLKGQVVRRGARSFGIRFRRALGQAD